MEKRLYEATPEDMNDLKTWGDPAEVQDYHYYKPIVDDIQREKEEAASIDEQIIIREANKVDQEGILNLSNRQFLTDPSQGLNRITEADYFVYEQTGKLFVATTGSGYIVGVLLFRLGESEGRLCGWELAIIVSRLFRRRGIASKLFDKAVSWSEQEKLTHINTRGLSIEGRSFLEKMSNNYPKLGFNLNDFGTSSILLKEK